MPDAVARAGGIVEPLETRRLLAGTSVQFLPLTGVRDVAFDAGRDILFASTSAGIIARYDLSAGHWLTPINSAALPDVPVGALDLSPDGRTLWAAPEHSSGGQLHAWRFTLDAAGDVSSATSHGFSAGGREGFVYDIVSVHDGRALFTTTYTGNSKKTQTPLRLIDAAGNVSIVSGAPGTAGSDVRGGSRLGRNLAGTVAVVAEAGPEGRVFLVDASAANGDLSFPVWRDLPAGASDGQPAVNGLATQFLVPRIDGQAQWLDSSLATRGTAAHTHYTASDVTNGTFGFVVDAVNDTAAVVSLSDLTFPSDPVSLGRDVPVSDGAGFDGGETTGGGHGRLLFATTATGIVKVDFGDPFTLDAGGAYAAVEGTPLALTASAVVPSGQVGDWAWDFDYDGVTFEADATGRTTSYTPPDGPATTTVAVRAVDRYGRSVIATAQVVVSNLAPTFATNGSGEVAEGDAFTLNFSAIDPGDDTVSSWSIDWGDGKVEALPGSATSAQHTYADGEGEHHITITAVDEDGSWSHMGSAGPSLDWTFNSGTGEAPLTGARMFTDAPARLLQLSDGRLLVATQTLGTGSAYDWSIFRFNSDGTPDESFGTDGKTIVTIPEPYSTTSKGSVFGVVEAPDGSVLIAGRSGVHHPALIRLRPNGTLDTSFGGGVVTLGDVETHLLAVSVITTGPQSGKILAVASAEEGQVRLIRFDAAGNLDTSYGSAGTGYATFALPESHTFAGGAIVEPDGTTYVGGWTRPTSGGPHQGYIVRFNSAGELDTSFGTGGATVFGWSDPYATTVQVESHLDSLAFDEQGRIWFAGRWKRYNTGSTYLGVGRFDPDGSMDASFGVDGLLALRSMPPIYHTPRMLPVAASSGGGAVVATTLSNYADNRNYSAVVRLGEGGVDTSFGNEGLMRPESIPDTGSSHIFDAILTEPPAVDGAMLPQLVFANGYISPASLRRFRMEGLAPYALIRDMAPTLSVTTGAPVLQDEPFTLAFSADDPGTDTITSWQISWGDGTVQTLTGDQTTAAHAYTAPGEYTVSLSATNEDGTFTAAPVVAVVNPAPPAGVIGVPETAPEGLPVVVVADDSTGTIDTFEWDFDYDGVTFTVDATGDTSHFNAGDGPAVRTIALRVTGPVGSDVVVKEIAVENVAPTVDATGLGAVDEGSPLTVSWTPFDRGNDTITQWRIDWGDGASDVLPGDARTATHTYTDGDAHHVLAMTAIDEDGVHAVALPPSIAVGDVDFTFGNVAGAGGYTEAAHGSPTTETHSLAVAADGALLMTGLSGNVARVMRFTADGQIDRSFGTDGAVTLGDGSLADRTYGLTDLAAMPLAGGSVLVAGYGQRNGSTYLDLVVTRLTSDGSIDTTFGDAAAAENAAILDSGAGWFSVSLGNATDGRHPRLIAGDDGQVMVALGASLTYNGETSRRWYSQAVRLREDLLPDPTYGSNGVATLRATGASAGDHTWVYSAALADDGSLVLGGYTGYTTTTALRKYALLKFDASGRPDRTFGYQGSVVYSWASYTDEIIQGIVLEPDGHILAGGTGLEANLLRLRPDGLLDPGFGLAGRKRYTNDPQFDTLRDLIRFEDGSMIAIGGSSVMVKLLPDGNPDRSFGAGGYRFLNTPSGPQEFGHLVVTPNGDFVAGATGRISNTSTKVWAMAQVAGTPRYIIVRNVVPQIAATLSSTTVAADEELDLTLSVTDAGDDTLTALRIDWGDGTVVDLPVNVTSATHAYADLGDYHVVVSTADEDGTWSVDAGIVQVVGPPQAEAGSDIHVNEGHAVRLSGAGSIGRALTWEWDFDYDGATFDVDATGESVFLPAADGPLTKTVALRVTNAAGSSIDTLTHIIKNVAPRIFSEVPTLTREGRTTTVRLYTSAAAYYDPGDDTITHWRVDWGDGYIETVVADSSHDELQHVYAEGDAEYRVRVWAIDEDGEWGVQIPPPQRDWNFGDWGTTPVEAGTAALHQDAAGYLWTAAPGKPTPTDGHDFYLSRFNGGGDPVVSWATEGRAGVRLPDDPDGWTPLSGASVHAILTVADGSIYIGGLRRLGRDDGNGGYESIYAPFLAKLTPQGNLDTGFGTRGHVRLGEWGTIGSSSLIPQGVVHLLQRPDGRIIAGGQFAHSFVFWQLTHAGEHDTSFGTNGIVAYNIPNPQGTSDLHQRQLGGILLDGDRLVAAAGAVDLWADDSGTTSIRGTAHLIAFTGDGSVDATFGDGGRAMLPLEIPAQVRTVDAVARDSQGRFVIAGSTHHFQLFVARFHADGTPDTSFGAGGSRVSRNLLIGTDGRFDTALVELADGGWLVAGLEAVRRTAGVMRLTADGQLDTALYGTGVTSISLSNLSRGYPTLPAIVANGEQIVLLTAQHDGVMLHRVLDVDAVPTVEVRDVPARISVDGPAEVFEGTPFSITFAASDPGDDPTIEWTVDWGDGTVDTLTGDATGASHVFADGPTLAKIVVTALNDDGHSASSELRPPVRLDPMYGDGGTTAWNASGTYQSLQDVQIAGDGSTWVASSMQLDLRLSKLLPNGGLDPDFGNGGSLRFGEGQLPVMQPNRFAHAAAANGGAFAADVGVEQGTGRPMLRVVKLTDTGGLDASFGAEGIVQLFVPGSGAVEAIVPLNDGGLILVGDLPMPSGTTSVIRPFVVKLLPDGSVDMAYGTPDAAGVTVVSPPTGAPEGHFQVADVALRPGGALVIGIAFVYAGSYGGNFAVLQLDATGRPDTSFGTGEAGAGWVVLPRVAGETTTDGFEALTNLVVAPDGALLLGGMTEYRSSSGAIDVNALVIRLLADGALDATFGNTTHAGVSRLDLTTNDPEARMGPRFRVQPVVITGQVMVLVTGDSSGSAAAWGGPPAALLRLLIDGTQDPTFDIRDDIFDGGAVNPSAAASGEERLELAAVAPDQTLLLAGMLPTGDSNSPANLVMMRLTLLDPLQVRNIAPTIDVVLPGTAETGQEVAITFAAIDPGADTVSQWHIDWGDGTRDILAGNVTGATHAYSAAGTYAVVATATDEDGAWSADAIAIAVEEAAVAPVADAGDDRSADEGTHLTLIGAATGGAVEMWEWDFDYDGSQFTPNATGQQVPFVAADGPAVRTVALRVTGPGGSSIDTFALSVRNVAPIIILDPVNYPMAGRVRVSGRIDDVPADAGAGFFNAHADLGDGREHDFVIVWDADLSAWTFAFDTLYDDPAAGPFTVTLFIEDRDGAIGSSSVAVAPEVRPAVEAFTVNAGSIQRSMVRELTVTFAKPLAADQDIATFRLYRRAADGSYSEMLHGFVVDNPLDDGRTWRIRFPESGGFSGNSLADGVYELCVAADVPRTFRFHRLFGDADGDRQVAFSDFIALRGAFGSLFSDANWNDAFDSNGDGRIDFADFLAFRASFGKALTD